MREYRRNRVLGATSFFTESPLGRRLDLLPTISGILGKPSAPPSKGARSRSTRGTLGERSRSIANSRRAHRSLGDPLTLLGWRAERIGDDEGALPLSPRDPLLANRQFDIGLAHRYLRNVDDGLTRLLRARSTNPNLPFASAVVLEFRRRSGSVIRHVRNLRRAPDDPVAYQCQ